MTLCESILAIVPTDEPVSIGYILSEIGGRQGNLRSAAEIVNCVDGMAKDGLLVHSFKASASHYRQRTEREIAEAQAERSGEQGRLL